MGTRNRIFGYPKSAKKCFWGNLNKAFFIFWHSFDDFTKFCNAFGTLHFEKSSKMWQKWRKGLFNLHFKPIFRLIPGTYPKIRFRVFNPQLIPGSFSCKILLARLKGMFVCICGLQVSVSHFLGVNVVIFFVCLFRYYLIYQQSFARSEVI